MIIKRLFPTRWARITAWTAAAIAWVVSVLATQTVAPSAAATPETTDEPTEAIAPVTQAVEVMPTAPEDGLLIIRFTPAPPPPPRVITQTVVVQGSGGAGSAAPPGFAPATPITKVQSTGS